MGSLSTNPTVAINTSGSWLSTFTGVLGVVATVWTPPILVPMASFRVTSRRYWDWSPGPSFFWYWTMWTPHQPVVYRFSMVFAAFGRAAASKADTARRMAVGSVKCMVIASWEEAERLK